MQKQRTEKRERAARVRAFHHAGAEHCHSELGVAQLLWNLAKRTPHRRKQQERRAERSKKRSRYGDERHPPGVLAIHACAAERDR